VVVVVGKMIVMLIYPLMVGVVTVMVVYDLVVVVVVGIMILMAACHLVVIAMD